jgi:selenocysteine-specific elongation factor
MPQTVEHARVLRALDVGDGVLAITKSDVADPAPAAAAARKLLPRAQVVPCSARTGAGLARLRGALDELAARTPSRARSAAAMRMHIDRVFTVAGRGTVVTGTLWSGTIARGEIVELLPAGRQARVRAVQVHDVALACASAGQRVAVNLTGVKTRELARGDVLAAPGSLRPTRVLDCELELDGARNGERVQVHHGTRAVPARLRSLGDSIWQLRLEQPLFAIAGDRLVVGRIAPRDTLGGGVVLDDRARRHGSRPELRARARTPAPTHAAGAEAREDQLALRALEQRLHDAGMSLCSEAQLGAAPAQLRALRAAGRAARVSGRLYAHADVLAEARRRILALIERDGATTLPAVRDALGTSRKSAQAFLEHLDGARLTRRLPDDRRVLAHRRQLTPR